MHQKMFDTDYIGILAL